MVHLALAHKATRAATDGATTTGPTCVILWQFSLSLSLCLHLTFCGSLSCTDAVVPGRIGHLTVIGNL